MKGLEKVNLKEGLNLYYIPTEKFKTSTMSICIHRQLSEEDATKNALLPYVLRRGCEKFPNAQAIAQYLESLYGAVFDCGINKKGEDQIIYFTFEVVNDEYIPEDRGLLQKIIEFSKCIIFNPVTENQCFKKEYVEQEKNKLKDLIEGLINNKVTYATERCFQEMCKGEKFGTYELGSAKDLEAIDEKNLYEHYKSIIKSSPIDIFITGTADAGQVTELVKNLYDIEFNREVIYPTTEIIAQVKKQKNIVEELDVAQGKLSLGFRTKISPREKDYYSLIVYNGILGGGPHSKLFNNVREKLSLAYYVFSRLEKFKGLMLISSGIEVQNYKKTLDEILLQMEEIKKGNISDYEYQSTINSSITSVNSLKDNSFYMIDYYLGQLVGGTDDSFEDLIVKISSVQKEDVISVAQKIELDTIYFLKNKNK
ncbi:MAG: hypothetical protein PWP27_576 [Clostridiales bacterium]|jgi:predicted Zn-dependent peptidase|nr:hypothetical protein [Clostridiales bacterium]MDK2932766.1 hypothetical protein [Clostridiales bacterium]